MRLLSDFRRAAMTFCSQNSWRFAVLADDGCLDIFIAPSVIGTQTLPRIIRRAR